MSASRNVEPQPLELEIFNLMFRLRAPKEEHERLMRAGKHVDTVMRELVASQPSADTTRLAIQAAFLIASDYFRTLDESVAGPGKAGEVGSRINDILKGLDIALAEMKSALRPPPADGQGEPSPTPLAPVEQPAPEA